MRNGPRVTSLKSRQNPALTNVLNREPKLLCWHKVQKMFLVHRNLGIIIIRIVRVLTRRVLRLGGLKFKTDSASQKDQAEQAENPWTTLLKIPHVSIITTLNLQKKSL